MTPAFQAFVYLLCLATSGICAGLLVRRYQVNRTRLLLWSAACFVLLAINNLFVVIDVLVLPASIDLLPLRLLASFCAVTVLLVGFIWDVD
jgi:hypothetical protein